MNYLLAWFPFEHLATILIANRHMPIERDRIGNIVSLNFPGVAIVEPVIWLLMLEAIDDGLPSTNNLDNFQEYNDS